MDKDTRNAIERATQKARKLLEADFGEQLAGTYDVLPSGVVAPTGGVHLSPHQKHLREKIVAAVGHKRASVGTDAEAVADYRRDVAFTALNRFVALKMLEARGLVQECVSRGDQSSGYREFCGLAPGVSLLPGGEGYRLYLECIFDELSTEVKVLFDRRDAASVLWPRRAAFEALLGVINGPELGGVWGEDETIGWVYQFFNTGDERRQMREESQAPRNSRELAVRNQFFTPRYVVEFLTDNTLGRTWWQMRGGETALAERCAYLVKDGEAGAPRAKKDPRDMKVLDPACGSGHFLLYAFDLLLIIYAEAFADAQMPRGSLGNTLREAYADVAALRKAVPGLILHRNLHGVDIDPRAAQIAALALWLRAQRAYKDFGVPARERPRIARTHIVVAEPMPGDAEMVKAFAADLRPRLLGELFRNMVGEMRLAGELGALLRVEQGLAAGLGHAREQYVKQRRGSGFLQGLGLEPLQGELDLSGIDDDSFFHEAEERIVDALQRFAESAAGGIGVRRRLFAGDAVQGVALIDLVRTRFDVVLMNPPFGVGSLATRKDLERTFPRSKNDLYACFVERGIQLLHKRGMIGALTSRTGFFLSSFRKWREEVLLKEAAPVVFADLGYGVLDSAMVEVAAYCLEVAT
jgi:hypothetical protein